MENRLSPDSLRMVVEFRKQWVDPESMRVQMSVVRRRSEFKVIMREFRL